MVKIFKHIDVKELLMIGASLIFIVAQVWLDLKLPEYMSAITLLVQTRGSAMSDIWLNGGYMLLCALGSMAAAIVTGFFAARIGASFSQKLRSKLFDKIDSFSMGEITKFSTASLITRSTNDVTQVQMLITMGLQMIVKAPILAVWAVIKIAGKGFEWTLITGAAVVLLLVMFAVIITLVMPKFKKIQTLTDNLNRVTRENLAGLPVVRAYNAQNYQEQKFETANKDLTQSQTFTSVAMSIMQPTMTLIMSGLSLCIYLVGAVLINSAGLLQRLILFSNLVVFSSYSMQVVMAFMMMAMLFVFLPRASVSAKRINEVLGTQPSITDGKTRQGLSQKQGEVEFKNVCFKYPGAAEYVLKDVSFTVKKGQTIAFIGSTGSGKSTLINLVPRFYDATQGEVLVGGVNVKDYKLETLYDKIGYIPQKAVMFSGTVASNVALGQNSSGENATDSDMQRAVKIAQADTFVESLKDAYHAPISRGGTNISGGQKQRLSIARAVYKNPEILIFDDSFSALDYKTDRELRTALKRETAGVTAMIVAQRIGTIMDADKIIVIDEGKVVGAGKHKELLQSCEVYREIALSQLSEEELAI